MDFVTYWAVRNVASRAGAVPGSEGRGKTSPDEGSPMLSTLGTWSSQLKPQICKEEEEKGWRKVISLGQKGTLAPSSVL